MSKKIAFALNYFVSEKVFGGVDKLIIALSIELSKRGYRVDIYFPKKLNASIFHYAKAGVKATLLEGDLFSESLLSILRKNHYDLLVTHFFTAYSKYLKSYKLYVSHIISVEHMSRPIEGKTLKRKIKDQVAYRLYSRYLDRTIHCCNYLREQDSRDYSPGVLKKSITIYNGVDCDHNLSFEESQGNKENGSLKVVCIGRLVYEKGFQHAIEAIRLLNSLDVTLDIYGDGPYRANLEKIAENNSKIRFHGFVSNITEVLPEADVLLLPSYQEAFPFVVLEAFSVGKIVIASNVGGIPEMIKDGRNGYMVKPKDSESIAAILEELYLKTKNVTFIQEQAYLTVKNKFSFTKMLDSHIEIIEEVLQ